MDENTQKKSDPHTDALFDLLGYSKPEPVVEKKPEPAPEVKPEPVVEKPAPVEPEKPAVVEAVTKKKVSVKKTEPAPNVEEMVRKAVADITPKPEEKLATVAETVSVEGLSEEDREEVELAQYAEKRDPTKVGLAKKVAEFQKARNEFIEKQRAEDPDYEPDSDPEFRKFIAKSEPKISPTEKRRLFVQREAEAAEQRAYERVKQEFEGKLKGTETQLREITERPKLAKKIEEVRSGFFKDVDDPVFKSFVEKPDVAAEEYPLETEILSGIQQETTNQAEEYLAVRSGLKAFDSANPTHARVNSFIVEQADLFEKHGGKALVRDGKPFIHPGKWRPEHAQTHWTFSEDDVLGALRVNAAREAKKKIASENQKIERAIAARTKKSVPMAPTGTKPVVTEEGSEVSPRSSSAPMQEGVKSKTVKDPTAALLGYE